MLVEFKIGKHFDTRDDTRRRIFREGHRIMKHTVNTISDMHFLLIRFDMDIRSLLKDRVLEECIHDTNDWEIGRHFLEIISASLSIILFLHSIRKNLTELCLKAPSILTKNNLNTLICGKTWNDFQASFLLDEIDCLKVVRTEHRHFQIRSYLFEGDDICFLRDKLRDNLKRLLGNRLLG